MIYSYEFIDREDGRAPTFRPSEAMEVTLEKDERPRFVRRGGGIVRQISELQPAGHWETPSGELQCGPRHAPGWIARRVVSWVLDWKWVDYGKSRGGW